MNILFTGLRPADGGVCLSRFLSADVLNIEGGGGGVGFVYL